MDFTDSELAKAAFDEKMAILKQADSAVAGAKAARDAAFAALQTAEQGVSDAEAAVAAADKEADIAFKVYTDELAEVNVVPADELPATKISLTFGEPVPKAPPTT